MRSLAPWHKTSMVRQLHSQQQCTPTACSNEPATALQRPFCLCHDHADSSTATLSTCWPKPQKSPPVARHESAMQRQSEVPTPVSACKRHKLERCTSAPLTAKGPHSCCCSACVRASHHTSAGQPDCCCDPATTPPSAHSACDSTCPEAQLPRQCSQPCDGCVAGTPSGCAADANACDPMLATQWSEARAAQPMPEHTALQAVRSGYKRRPRRPPFRRVESVGIGVTSSAYARTR